VQQPLQAFALLVGQRAGEDALALLISALAGCTDEPPEGAPPGPQNAVVHQNLAGAGEQRGAAHCGDPGARPQPLDELHRPPRGSHRAEQSRKRRMTRFRGYCLE
jgi:hypothetical protein